MSNIRHDLFLRLPQEERRYSIKEIVPTKEILEYNSSIRVLYIHTILTTLLLVLH